MRSIIVAMVLLVSPVAMAQTTLSITITTAQQDAETMARTGVLRHCRTAGGRLEGIGVGSSRDQAIRNCCYWGRPYIDLGVARSIRTGRYYACVRYK
jgi:hypothetical protein